MSDQESRGARAGQLGKGLSALFGEERRDYASLDAARHAKTAPVEHLHPNRYQPRRQFEEDELAELADSMTEHGVLQPILVRRHPERANEYEIIAGERRWRAAQRARLHEVPVVVRDVTDAVALELAIIENVQRQNLNPIDEAEAYRRLMSEFSHTQEDLSHVVGKSRSHVANTLRLLTLPAPVRDLLVNGKLSAGHARALVGADNAEALARAVVAEGLSVRETEKLVRGNMDEKPPRKPSAKPADTVALEKRLSDMLGLKVSVSARGESGKLTVRFETLDQLDDLIRRLGPGTA